MANTILIKRSNVANSVPASGNLQAGELAINYTDGNLFFKDNNGNVQTIASQKFVSVSGNVTAGNIVTGGQIVSTVPTGTAPLSITSTTLVGNLYVARSVLTDNSRVNVGDGYLGLWSAASGNLSARASNSFTITNSTGTLAGPVISATGNITGGNIRTAGLVSAGGNVTAGNVLTTGLVSATGNVTGGNLVTGGVADITGNVNAGNVLSIGLISATGNVTGNYFIGNGSQLTGIQANAFSTISVASQSNVVSNSTGVVNFVSGSGMTITTDPTTGSVTFVSTSVGSIFQTGGTMGLVTAAVTSAEDLGLITDIWTVGYDLGTLVVEGLIWPEQLKLPSYTVAGLPSPGIIGLMAFATNAAGGSIPVFSDGSNWRRVDDRSIVT